MSVLRDRDHFLGEGCGYEATVQQPRALDAPSTDQSCDVAVVGGGLAGLSAALALVQRGFSVRVLEGARLGRGASGRNGGQVILGLACEMETIERQLGLARARDIFAMTVEAVAAVRQHVAHHAIDAQWQDGFLSVATSPRKAVALSRWAQRMRQTYGQTLQDIGPAELRRWIDSPRFHGAVHDPVSGHLNPLRLALDLARAAQQAGAQLHEQTPVTSLSPDGPRWHLQTPTAAILAEHVLLAGNVLQPEWLTGSTDPTVVQAMARMHERTMPVGTFVACTEPIDPTQWDRLLPSRAAVCTTDVVLDYFRPTADHRLLFGGGVSYSGRVPNDLSALLGQRIALTFPSLAGTPLTHAWGGFVDITMNRAPDFGRLGDRAQAARNAHPALKRVYYLRGFSGHGVALTVLAGRLVAEAIAGDASRLDVFARLRHHAFPGGSALRTPLLVLGMAWARLRDLLG